MTRVIGLCGRGRSGKSTTAASMKQEASLKGYRAEIFELSNYVIRDLILTGDIPEGSTRETTPVALMVERGTDVRKSLPDHWINKMQEDINSKSPDIAIVPNIRFLNEASHIQGYRYGDTRGIIVRVKRLVRDGVEFISPDRDPNHISETEQVQILADYTLINQGYSDQLLVRQAKTLMNYILEVR